MGIQFDGINNEIKSQTKIDFPGSIGIAGTLTYEDVKNVDSIGIITARTGIKIGPTAGVAGTFFADGSYVTAGVVTATAFHGSGANLTNLPAGNLTGTLPAISGANLTGIDTDLVSDTSPQLGGDLDTNSHHILLDDSHAVKFGNSTELEITHTGSSGFAHFGNTTGHLMIDTSGNFYVRNATGAETYIQATANGAVDLYHDNTKTAWTHGSGFNIKGGNTSDNTELIITGNEGQPASILMSADDGDDNADHWRMYSNADNSFTLNSYAGGSYQSILKGTSSRSIELNYQGSKKLETSADGAIVTGELDVFKSGVGDVFHVRGNGTGAVVAKVENAYNSDNDRFAILELKSGKGSIRFNSNGDSNEGAITYNMADNTMVFGVNNATERLRIGAVGQIGVAGANYGTARETIVSGGASAAVSWSANPFVIDMASLGDLDPGKLFVRYREVNVTGNGLVYLEICKSTTNCGPGRSGYPIGFVPGVVYNSQFRVDKVGITPWPNGSGHRYEFFAIISDYVAAGKLGIYYLTNTTS